MVYIGCTDTTFKKCHYYYNHFSDLNMIDGPLLDQNLKTPGTFYGKMCQISILSNLYL